MKTIKQDYASPYQWHDRIKKLIGGKCLFDYMENPGFVSFRLSKPIDAFHACKKLAEYGIETKRIEGVFIAIYQKDFEKLTP